MIQLSMPTFDDPEILEHDENVNPTDDLASSTSEAVKESQIQVSFAEQTASEMRQILSDWNAAASPEKKQLRPMRRNSLALDDDVMKERSRRRSLSISSPQKMGKVDVQSPTHTIETEMMDSESEVSDDGSYLNESLRVNDSFVGEDDDLPQISFLPSSAVLRQNTEVESILRNSEMQSSELDRTLHATKYDVVMIQLMRSHGSLRASTEPQNEPPSEDLQEIDSLFMMTSPSMKEGSMKNKKKNTRRRIRRLIAYLVVPIALSILVAKVFGEYGPPPDLPPDQPPHPHLDPQADLFQGQLVDLSSDQPVEVHRDQCDRLFLDLHQAQQVDQQVCAEAEEEL